MIPIRGQAARGFLRVLRFAPPPLLALVKLSMIFKIIIWFQILSMTFAVDWELKTNYLQIISVKKCNTNTNY